MLHNTICDQIKAIVDSNVCETADALAQDWREGVSFVLPDFHAIDQVLGRIQAENATAIFILPEWTYKPW